MTQSRGPWLGCGVGLMIAAVGLAKNRKRAAIIALSLAVVYISAATVILSNYTDTSHGPTDIDQQNAQYRRQLIDTYTPMVKAGGLFGWGSPHLLRDGSWGYLDAQPSVDNHYLLLAIAQGYLGVGLFLALVVLSALTLLRNCIRFTNRDDSILAFCLLGILIGSAVTLTTVALGCQMCQLFYLLIGWAESLRPSGKAHSSKTITATSYAFERVFV